MPRSATTADPFNAIAERQRRRILDLLTGGDFSVNEIVVRLGLAQPQISKHLRVLRAVDLVHVRGAGRQRIYSLNAQRLKPIHDWTATFERFWDQQLDRIKQRAESAASKKKS